MGGDKNPTTHHPTAVKKSRGVGVGGRLPCATAVWRGHRGLGLPGSSFSQLLTRTFPGPCDPARVRRLPHPPSLTAARGRRARALVSTAPPPSGRGQAAHPSGRSPSPQGTAGCDSVLRASGSLVDFQRPASPQTGVLADRASGKLLHLLQSEEGVPLSQSPLGPADTQTAPPFPGLQSQPHRLSALLIQAEPHTSLLSLEGGRGHRGGMAEG